MALSHGLLQAGAVRLPPGLVEPPAVAAPTANLYLASLLHTAKTQQVINHQAAVIQNLHLQLYLRDTATNARPQATTKHARPRATKKHAMREQGTLDVGLADESFKRGVSGGSACDGFNTGGFTRGVSGGSTFDGFDGGGFTRGVTEPPPGLRGDDEFFTRGVSGGGACDGFDTGGFTRGVSGGSAFDCFDGGGFARGVTGGSTTDDGGFQRGVTGGSTTDGFSRAVTGGSTTDGCVTDGEEGSKRRARAARRYPRPTKTQRELYRTYVDDIEKRLREDPAAFDVDALDIPKELTHNDTAHEMLTVKAKFRLRRLQAELLGQPQLPEAAPPGLDA